MRAIPLTITLLSLVSLFPCDPVASENVTSTEKVTPPLLEEGEALEYLDNLEEEYNRHCNEYTKASWARESDLNDRTAESKQFEVGERFAEFRKNIWLKVKSFKWQEFNDTELRRKFSLLETIGDAVLDEVKFLKYHDVTNNLTTIYHHAKICDFHNKEDCNKALNPDILDTLARSRDLEELKYIWTEWRDQTGLKMKDNFREMIRLTNEISRLNGMKDIIQYDLHPYMTPYFEEELEEVWTKIFPLYKQLHAYVRRKLRVKYGENFLSRDEPIPAHVFGDMWAQDWSNILDLVIPYRGKVPPIVTSAMKKQGYTPERMARMAEDFFVSLGFEPMTDTFWSESILTKQDNRDMACNPTSWDFCDKQDYRLMMCAEVNMNDLSVLHHEMGHIHYSMESRNQSFMFRAGANPGFDEAVGEALALSVSTPSHLEAIDLLKDVYADHEIDINYLMIQALEKIVFLPFSYMVNKWRWDVFSAKIPYSEMNCHWWKTSLKYRGIVPPTVRTNEDFDAGGKYHIIANIPFTKYFVATILQFQLYRSLCSTAGQYDPLNPTQPLYKCDFYKSQEAGEKLRAMLRLGRSVPWQDALETLTGERKLNASALRDYFKPLEDWLVQENLRNQEYVGWNENNIHCVWRKNPEPETEYKIEPEEKKNFSFRSSADQLLLLFLIFNIYVCS